jgi:flagellar M-ring protein FliF
MPDQEILAPNTTHGTRRFVDADPAGGNPLFALKGLLRQNAVQRALPAIGIMAALALSAAAYYGLQTPRQVPLFQGLSDNDKAGVTEALQASGLAYSLDDAAGTITVDEDKLHQARILLAGQGLPKAAPAGDALRASLPMGSSRALEGETLRGAREADLARTIEAIDVVKSARIHIATPEPSVFVREIAAPAASVMLTLQSGRNLTQAQVRAIRHLVAASVPNMTPQQVSIIDQSGALLSDNSADGDDANFQLQVQMETRYRQALNSLLGPMIGAGNYSAEVHVDVDSAESQSTRESFPKDDRALRTEQGNSQIATPAEELGGGIPGATSNEPPAATVVASKPDGLLTAAAPPVTVPAPAATEETYSRSFDVGREISVTHNPRGQLRRLSVAVALRDPLKGKPRTKAEIAAIENLVKGAVGFNGERGDIVAISSRKFAETEAAKTNFWDEQWFMPALRQAGALMIAILLLLFVGRPLIKLLRNKAADSAAHNEALSQQLLEVTNRQGNDTGQHSITLEMIEAAPGYEARANLVRSFVRQDSERAAMIVRNLMHEAKSNG